VVKPTKKETHIASEPTNQNSKEAQGGESTAGLLVVNFQPAKSF
jgi:hypothetical protein